MTTERKPPEGRAAMAQNRAAPPTPPAPALHEILHDEAYRLRFEALVFEIANQLAVRFRLRGTGQVLQDWLEEPAPPRSDAEVLLRLVIETLLGRMDRDKARLYAELDQRIEQAGRARGRVA